MNKLFMKNIDVLAIAILFVVMSYILNAVNFWQAIGLPTPQGFVFQGLLFLTLVVVFYHTIFEPFMAISDERLDQTVGKRKRAEEKNAQAQAMSKNYDDGLLKAKLEAFRKKEQISLAAEEEEKKHLEAAKLKSQSDLEKAMKEISAKIEVTRAELLSSTQTLVAQIVEDVLSPKSSKSSSTTNSTETRM